MMLLLTPIITYDVITDSYVVSCSRQISLCSFYSLQRQFIVLFIVFHLLRTKRAKQICATSFFLYKESKLWSSAVRHKKNDKRHQNRLSIFG